MNPRVVPFAAMLRSSETMFERALAGITHEQGLASIGTGTNPLFWIAAHVTSTRYGLAQLVGLDRPSPWGTRFGRGAELGDLASIPEAANIRAAWTEISPALLSRLEELADAEIDARSPRELPVVDKSVLGAIAFLTYHEGYHVGQMALLRKALGLGALNG